MKRSLVTLLTFSIGLPVAQAQTQIGGVTLTKPNSRPAPITTPRSSTGASAPRATTTRTDTVAVPSGWYEISGRISAAKSVILPADSTVNVVLSNQSKPAQLLHISFKTSRLPTTYQMVFNPARLNTAHQYVLRATVIDKAGKTLYTSNDTVLAKGAHNVDLNLR